MQQQCVKVKESYLYHGVCLRDIYVRDPGAEPEDGRWMNVCLSPRAAADPHWAPSRTAYPPEGQGHWGCHCLFSKFDPFSLGCLLRRALTLSECACVCLCVRVCMCGVGHAQREFYKLLFKISGRKSKITFQSESHRAEMDSSVFAPCLP